MGSERPLRVMVVDDDEPACAATTWMIESLGYRGDAETDALSALKVFSEDPDKSDLAIIEPILPDLTGLDLAVRLRHIRPGFPVLFYVGYADESLTGRIEAESLGHVAFTAFAVSELAKAMRDRLSPEPEHSPLRGGR